MTGKTHILGGVAAAATLHAFGMEYTAAMTGATVLGALLPDIDHINSKISSENAATKTLSGIITVIFGHRGFIHTPLFIILISIGLFLFSESELKYHWVKDMIIPLAAGMVSHLFLDSLNPTGILWLWPLSFRRYRLASVTTGTLGEVAVAILLIMLIVMSGWQVISPYVVKLALGI